MLQTANKSDGNSAQEVMSTYPRDGGAPDGHHVAGQLVQVLADELQRLGAHHPVDEVYAVQQRRHGLGEGTKVVGQGLQPTL